jgi:2-haloacid dehalogenase
MVAGRIPGTAEMLYELSAASVPLFALSNWSRETFPLIEPGFPELGLFQQIFLSADFGAAKPDLSIFEWALGEIGVRKSDLLFIDDNVRNVNAARHFGLPSHAFVNSAELRKSLTDANILPSH